MDKEKRYPQKKIRRYVIATLDIPTFYLQYKGRGKWRFVTDIENTTKTVSKNLAIELINLYYHDTNRINDELVTVPIEISYDILEGVD